MNENPVIPQDKVPQHTADWKKTVARYQKPAVGRAVWQLVNTLVPYTALWYLMYLSLGVSWWLTVPLTVLAGAFLVRVFIIFHDCGHGSFFRSQRANHVLGFLTGVLTFNASSPTKPQASVPLTTAVGPVCLPVTPDPLDFGTMKIGTAHHKHVAIANLGTATLQCNIETDGSVYFSCDTGTCGSNSPSLGPGASCSLTKIRGVMRRPYIPLIYP